MLSAARAARSRKAIASTWVLGGAAIRALWIIGPNRVNSDSSRLTIFKLSEYGCRNMQTVDSIIKSVYGSDAAAANALGVVRSAVSNWKAWGHFPMRLVVPIWRDAKNQGVEIQVDEIPTMDESQ